jgi:histidine triad (HIT) family protein
MIMEVTIFDKILSGEIPSNKVYEDEDVLAFHDVNPQAPIHVLVIPKKKVATFTELKDRPTIDSGVLFQKTALIADKLGLDDEGYRIVVNCGENGNQEVAYLHAHILGGRKLTWPPG